ncbi:MAG: SAM-dependent methyltransferase [Firmicutes bacterium]|jgi:SAM-dependent methyltransferase|nr:SAM-dependent methyltransferase [Bacillota bacterium]
MDKLKQLFENIFLEDKPVKLIFSSKRRKSLEYSKVTIKPISSKDEPLYQAEYTFEKKVTHTNFPATAGAEFCLALIENDFKQANIFTNTRDIQILASKPENPKISENSATMTCQNFNHNRVKNYIIPDGVPCDFLIRLGVMDSSGKVFQKHYGKFRQINRYLEIVDDVFPYLSGKRMDSEKPLRIIDFGCGKAYLTFAIYHYLKIIKGLKVEIIGLDLKSDVINFCNQVASDLGYGELKFLRGDIADYTNDYADMVVTLHACDTATDYALINAVAWNTKVILSVPCCQHELFKQIKNSIHQPMLKHGILKDRLTEYLTDGLRGLKLESKGYDVSMIEFTSLEHTARNIMIKAVKRFDADGTRAAKAQKQYEELRDFYQVNPTIDVL